MIEVQVPGLHRMYTYTFRAPSLDDEFLNEFAARYETLLVFLTSPRFLRHASCAKVLPGRFTRRAVYLHW